MTPLLLQHPVEKMTEEEFYNIDENWPLRLFMWLRERRRPARVTSDRAACPSTYPASP